MSQGSGGDGAPHSPAACLFRGPLTPQPRKQNYLPSTWAGPLHRGRRLSAPDRSGWAGCTGGYLRKQPPGRGEMRLAAALYTPLLGMLSAPRKVEEGIRGPQFRIL